MYRALCYKCNYIVVVVSILWNKQAIPKQKCIKKGKKKQAGSMSSEVEVRYAMRNGMFVLQSVEGRESEGVFGD